MTEVLVAEEHAQLFDLWAERGERGLSVCHLDYHCDMRGLFIDRRRDRARFVWQCDPYMNRIDSGSFMAHAVMQGIVTRLCWIHDAFGGREYDDLYCVKYESDLTALPFRLGGAQHWLPLDYVEQTFDTWQGPQQAEYLSLDWDGLAFVDYDLGHIRKLTTALLGYDFQPRTIFVSRSADYCHPDRALFDGFINALERKFATRAVWLPHEEPPPLQPPLPWAVYHGFEHRLLRLMRKLGIY